MGTGGSRLVGSKWKLDKPMDKRTFLKTSGTLLTGAMLSPLVACEQAEQADPRTNWAGNVIYSTERLSRPRSVEEVQEIVRSSRKVRPLGTRHSFNTIADSRSRQLSTEHLNEGITIDEAESRVTVEAGIRYGELCAHLHERGYAIHNLASLPHISVAGACATATHGSGVENGNLATAVTGLEIVDADGELRTLDREEDPERFRGAVVGLGSLGVVTRVELELIPAFEMYQHVYRELPIASVEKSFDAIMSSGYSVSLFTAWGEKTVDQVWVKRVAEEAGPIEPASEFYGARPAETHMHPIAELSAEPCTRQMGEVGPWFRRLPHFRLAFTPSSGDELQTEFLVPQEHARDVFRTLHGMRKEIAPLLLISEIRTIAADDLWMSTAHGAPSVAFHFTWKPDWEGVRALLPRMENALEPYEARPHWGKLFTMSPDRLRARYDRLDDFRELAGEFDPNGTFRNAFVETYLFET